MPVSETNITSSVIIRSNKILRNGDVVFESLIDGLEFLREAYEEGLKIDYPKFYKMDVLGKLGIIATDVLLKDFDFAKYKSEEVGIVLSNKNASIEADINYFETARTFPSPALFVYTLPNIVIGEISIRYKFKGENAFFVSEGFDADWLYFYVNDIISRGLKACICGWVEASENNFDVCIFLVETSPTLQNGMLFDPNNLKDIYSGNNLYLVT